jgi:NADP-dependent 3-hydroxy acid dehydrogenase YdfG
MNSVRTVVVSGGGTGIGSAVARRLAGGGRPVTIVGRRRDRLDQVAAPFAPLIDVVAADVATVAGAEAVASFVDWLLGADGGWVTGQVLSPNGGSVLGR